MTPEQPDFERLIARHGPELLAYLTRLLRDRHDAEDVCQEALLRAYRAFDRLKDNSNPRAWLYRVTTNTALNFMKKRSRIRERQVERELEGLPAAPHASNEQSEDLRRIDKAVRSLPLKQRAALMQRQFHGLTYEDIGVSLGCSAQAARANVYQAIKKLRAALKRH